MHKIDTKIPPRTRSDSTDDDPQSVIHAPSGFKDFQESKSNGVSPTDRAGNTVISPSTPEALANPEDKVMLMTSVGRININKTLIEAIGRITHQNRPSAIYGSIDSTCADETRT